MTRLFVAGSNSVELAFARPTRCVHIRSPWSASQADSEIRHLAFASVADRAHVPRHLACRIRPAPEIPSNGSSAAIASGHVSRSDSIDLRLVRHPPWKRFFQALVRILILEKARSIPDASDDSVCPTICVQRVISRGRFLCPDRAAAVRFRPPPARRNDEHSYTLATRRSHGAPISTSQNSAIFSFMSSGSSRSLRHKRMSG